MIELYENNGKLTFKEQKTFTCRNWFYQSMRRLKDKSFIETEFIELNIEKGLNLSNRRIKIYLLTYKGLKLVKLLTD